MATWEGKKKILCVRLDNMGDVLMSTPAIRALKKSFGATITLLTSSAAAPLAPFVEVDEVIISDVPWVKTQKNDGIAGYIQLISTLRDHRFDAAVIFTVFSQNPMPAILLTYLAGIPARLAYCRENPYELLSDWVPDAEPYAFVQHQVLRDLQLVAAVGAATTHQDLQLRVPQRKENIFSMLRDRGIDPEKPWILVHPCASEAKREYPVEQMATILRLLSNKGIQLVFSGVEKEKQKIEGLIQKAAIKGLSLAGRLTIEEWLSLIYVAPLLLSVNTGPVHIAAAYQTPVVVLYARTNPQHTPWLTPHHVFGFPVDAALKSRNEVLRFIDLKYRQSTCDWPLAGEVSAAVMQLMRTVAVPPAPPVHIEDVASSRP